MKVGWAADGGRLNEGGQVLEQVYSAVKACVALAVLRVWGLRHFAVDITGKLCLCIDVLSAFKRSILI